MKRILPLLAALVFLSGCSSLFDVNLFVVGEQTALEKQVLGTYSALGEDLLVYSSVRGVDPDGSLKTPPPATDSQQAVFAAMRNKDYNRDDVEALLIAGVVGESINGLLVRREGAPTATALTAAEADTVITEENADRETVLRRLVETSGAGDERRDEIARIFAGINRDAAPVGSWIESSDGGWTRK